VDRVGPRLLLIETSGRSGFVAVADGAEVRAVRPLDEARRHARDLAPGVAELLSGQGWRARDLDGVVVGRGPGSYTGLRVGIMSARAVAYATGCALQGVETFAAIAMQLPGEATEVDVLADAQQDKVYVQRFTKSGEWRPVATLDVRPVAEWIARGPAQWASGPGLRVVGDRLPAGVVAVPVEWRDPKAESLLRLGMARYEVGDRDNVMTLEPLYARASSAEEKRVVAVGPG
jgi:tRNA threonylcarbamoyladenosine biosynthesis protein TsaB